MTIKKYILFSISTMLLAGCTSEDINNAPAEERLPLRLEATLSTNRAATRAAGKQFEENDILLSYVRHVYANSDIKTESDYSKYNKVQGSLVKFTTATTGTALYWDDFSKSDSEVNDLRTENHGLQSYYGYCYNGGTPSTPLTEDTGVLGWATDGDQSTDGDMMKNDLLWSSSQKAIEYNHAKGAHGTLTIPYTHAMSKFTIVLVAGDGFVANDLTSASVTLHGMNSEGVFTAPTSAIDVTGSTPIDVKMYANTVSTSDNSRAYEAVAVPLTALTENNLLATISNVAGNDYKVYVSGDMLTNWKDGIKEGKTQSGINYKLTVTLKKQAVNVVSSLADWTDVSATGIGEIQFTADVTDCGISNSLKANDKFTLWRAVKGTDELTENDFTEYSTATFDGTNFTYSPILYWPNKDDCYYFRALATMSGTAISDVTEKTVNMDSDILWATTPAHKTYKVGDAIAPRTGEVPLAFQHAMSKVVITLSTKTDNTDPAYVDLSKATFELTNLSTSGIIALSDGKITPNATSAIAFSDGASSIARIMVPQTIGDKAKLIVNLHDGATDAESTTYSLQLNTCVDSSKAIITKWLSGKQYNYTISISKEEMKFIVQIADWTPSTGSGNATLDWD